MSEVEQIPAIPVHIAGAAAGVQLGQAAAAPGPPAVKIRLYTVVLTSDEPVKQLLPPEPRRDYALVQVFDNDIVLADSKSTAQAAANTNDTSLLHPVGAVIPTGVVVPIVTASEVWAGAASYNTRVSIIAGYR